MCLSGALTVWLIVYGAQETRGSVLLTHRAERLRRETGDPRYRVPFDPPNMRRLIWTSCTRPMRKRSTRVTMITRPERRPLLVDRFTCH